MPLQLLRRIKDQISDSPHRIWGSASFIKRHSSRHSSTAAPAESEGSFKRRPKPFAQSLKHFFTASVHLFYSSSSGLCEFQSTNFGRDITFITAAEETVLMASVMTA